MKSTIYKLKAPVDGVEEIALFAPTRKHMKFSQGIKQAFMRAAMEQAKGSEQKPSNDDEAGELDGEAMFMALMISSEDLNDHTEKFIKACTESEMCKASGGPVPSGVWDGMTQEDIEGAFKSFLGNFITI